MNIKSLGYQTHLMVDGFDSEIVDHGSYLSIVTSATPSYYWGNFLLFPDPPKVSDLIDWQRIFEKEIGYRPDIEHQAFGWDSPVGELGQVDAFQEAGFGLGESTVF